MGREPVTDTKIVDSDASDTGKVRDEQEEGEITKKYKTIQMSSEARGVTQCDDLDWTIFYSDVGSLTVD